jgi:hypothetical protein
MSRVVDITQRLKTEPVFFVFDGEQYKLDDRKNTVLKAFKVVQDTEDDTEGMDKALAILLGEKPAKEITKDLSFAGYKALFASVMSEVTQTPYEEAEARFQS